jgi:hypothetical protein
MPEQRRPSGDEDGEQAGRADVAEILNELLQLMRRGEPIPMTLAGASKEEEQAKKGELNDRLVGLRPVPRPRGPEPCIKPASVAFPPCTDVMLSLIRTADTDEVTRFFKDYFTFCDHRIVVGQERLDEFLDPDLLGCSAKWFENVSASQCPDEGGVDLRGRDSAECEGFPYTQGWPPRWPAAWCLPPSCVTLAGGRHLYADAIPEPTGAIKRLFVADLVWLFYLERLGIFQILGRILDEYAYKGGFPISNGVVDAGIRDDVVALVLESMVRQTEAGTSSKVRDRDTSYRRSLAWTSEAGRTLGAQTAVGSGFTTLFHQFIYNALEFYKDKRLAVAIQGASGQVGRPSVSTLVTIGDSLELLKKSFENFDYGRNLQNTLSGIVWVIAGMTVIRELRATLGIPPEYEKPEEYIPAAYDILVLGRAITPAEANRYTTHRECADDARDILLDIEVLDHRDVSVGGELDLWLAVIEDKIEGYRAAFREVTGVDLGAGASPSIPQQVAQPA